MAQMPQRVAQWRFIAQAVGPLYDVDALLILAIVDKESRGGEALQPRGPEGLGDHGNGHGLGQIDGRYHPTLIAALGPDGRPLWMDPPFALLLIAKHLHFLRDYFDGVVPEPMLPAIASYNARKERVRDKVRELPLPILREHLIAALDPLTTPSTPGQPGDYLSDVLRRRSGYVVTP